MNKDRLADILLGWILATLFWGMAFALAFEAIK